ncbi:3-deoxy-7-phosphoheptulonate synthase [Gammaproteobacteria bacterium]|nr:3-deoxy-7-phosphoheptulonate synthase [Gammaproteobacteria bacterium]
MTMRETDDLRIARMEPVDSPNCISGELPVTAAIADTVASAREQIVDILDKRDDRLHVVVGPCSIHDREAALEYAERLKGLAERYSDDLMLMMRVYFEKPRTTVGWKGLINDPDLDQTFNINKGLRVARSLLLEINALGLSAGTEYLDPISPQYIADLIGWGAIGARTTESQVHRELTSGLSCPIGLKNGTLGDLQIAIDGIRAASKSHHFLSITKDGQSAIFSTRGNEDCHLILRGGLRPNYDTESVDEACDLLKAAGLPERVMIDFSHANSKKQFGRQMKVSADVARQIASGDQRIVGVMIESHLVEGNQKVIDGQPLTYGQSITDACIGWDDTERVLEELAQSVKARR